MICIHFLPIVFPLTPFVPLPSPCLPLPPTSPPPSALFPPSQVGLWRGLTNKMFDLEAQIMTQASATEKQTVKVKKLKQQVWGEVWAVCAIDKSRVWGVISIMCYQNSSVGSPAYTGYWFTFTLYHHHHPTLSNTLRLSAVRPIPHSSPRRSGGWA